MRETFRPGPENQSVQKTKKEIGKLDDIDQANIAALANEQPEEHFALEQHATIDLPRKIKDTSPIQAPDEAEALEIDLDEEPEIPESYIEALVETREAAEKVTEKWWQKVARNTKKIGAAASGVMSSIAAEATKGARGLGADIASIPSELSKKFETKRTNVTLESLLEKPKEYLASAKDLAWSTATNPLDIAHGYQRAIDSMPVDGQDTKAKWLAKEGLQGAGEVVRFFKSGVTDSLETFGVMSAYEGFKNRLHGLESKQAEPLLQTLELTQNRTERYDKELGEIGDDARQAAVEFGFMAIQAREQFEQEHAEAQAEILMAKLEQALAEAKDELKKTRSKVTRQMLETKIQGIEQDINEHEKLMGLVEQLDVMAGARDLREVA
jgi:hypothetical protein